MARIDVAGSAGTDGDGGRVDTAPAPAPPPMPGRAAAERQRAFRALLLNTAAANITTSFLWFGLTFWIYLATRNVIATGVVGGLYMLLMALTSITFGTLVDRHRKLAVMRAAGLFTLVLFALAGAVYLLAPQGEVARLDRPWLWVFALLVLIGAVVENLRNVALATTVTILIDPDDRARANGLVGMVQGMAFLVTSVFSGLAIGRLGMGWTQVIAFALTAAALAHLLTVSLPEEATPAASDAHGAFDLAGSWRAVQAVGGLFALICFSTFNNFIGGAYMALMDPYGIELYGVTRWGLLLAVASTGFILGGMVVGRVGLGRNPLRTLLLCVMAMGALGAVFTIRESGLLFIAGCWAYMTLVPAVEAAEQTVIQRVVPLERQGRVFGFAGAFEASAAPVTAFLVAPLTELLVLPWARSGNGAEALAPLLGHGDMRGVALVFLVAGAIMVLAAALAFASPVYRTVSRTYCEEHAESPQSEAGAPAPAGG